MRIQHNIMAMNAYRNYNNNTSALAKNLERLSSGYKINRAGDDAAGLAISEKMRAQITGLEAAQKNVKDGISLVNTAEGAMQEIQDMLNRMVSLATQSANGTYDNEVDRANLQKEVESLKSEINRIADSANFNGINLLDGSQYAGGDATVSDITLPEVTRPIGDGTILRQDGTPVQKTEFAVQFDNLAINATAGDKLTVSIGGTDIELDLDTTKRYEAKDLAALLKDTFDPTSDKFGASGKEQAFTAKLGADGTSVIFTQTANPTGPDDTVEASMDVKMTFTSAADNKPVVLNDGIQTFEAAEAKKPAVTATAGKDAGFTAADAAAETPATALTSTDLSGSDLSSNLTAIKGASLTFGTGTSQVTVSLSSLSSDGTDVAALKSEIETLINDAFSTKNTSLANGTDNYTKFSDAVVTLDSSGISVAYNGSAQTYAAATSATVDVDFTGLTGADVLGDTVTIGDKTYEFVADAADVTSGNVAVVVSDDDAASDLTSTFKSAVDGATPSGTSASTSGTTVTVTSDTAGASVTLTGSATDAAGEPDDGGDEAETVNLKVDLSAALGSVDLEDPTATITASDLTAVKTALNALGAGSGKVVINQDVEVDLTDIDDDIEVDNSGNTTVKDLMQAIANRAKAAADAWNADNADEDYTYENARTSLTAQGSPNDDVMGLANNTGEIYILMDKTPKSAAGEPMPAAVSGSYNAATVKITQGSAEDGGARASTTINLGDIFGGDIADGSKLKIGDEEYTFKWGESSEAGINGNTITLDKNASAADRINAAGKYLSNAENSAFSIGSETTDGKITIDEKTDNTKFATELKTKEGFESLFSVTKVAPEIEGAGLTLQIGDTSASYNQLTVSIKDMHVSSLGIADIDIGTPEGAHAAIDKIKAAINTVSSVRGDLGAISNRLDHTANNLSVMAENITDAESTIRDTDIAEEMMAYTKNNILVQSAQAMLAQANQVPQGVLQLLQ